MKKKVMLLSSGHPPKDERMFSKIGYSLSTNGYSVVICTSTEELHTTEKSIFFDCFDGEKLTKREKINKFYSLLSSHSPDIIISSEPLPILAAHQFKKNAKSSCKVISDITEWYPENVAFKFSGIKKWVTYFVLYLFNIYATNLADALFLGEKNKIKRYKLISPSKQKMIIPYYPILNEFKYSALQFDRKNLSLNFSGTLSVERGFFRFIEVVNCIAEKHKNIMFTVVLSGRNLLPEDESSIKHSFMHKNISLEVMHFSNYEDISVGLQNVHICFDLRELNFVFDSIPIKFFEYLACGKPVIYSNIQAVVEEFKDINFGFLVDPNNIDEIVSRVENYINNPELLLTHSQNGRKLIEEKYNWEAYEKKLLHFLNQLKSKLSS